MRPESGEREKVTEPIWSACHLKIVLKEFKWNILEKQQDTETALTSDLVTSEAEPSIQTLQTCLK